MTLLSRKSKIPPMTLTQLVIMIVVGVTFGLLAVGFIKAIVEHSKSYDSYANAEMRSRRAHPSNRMYRYEPGQLYDWDQEEADRF